MAGLISRWSTEGVPSSLGWWIPSTYKLSTLLARTAPEAHPGRVRCVLAAVLGAATAIVVGTALVAPSTQALDVSSHHGHDVTHFVTSLIARYLCMGTIVGVGGLCLGVTATHLTRAMRPEVVMGSASFVTLPLLLTAVDHLMGFEAFVFPWLTLLLAAPALALIVAPERAVTWLRKGVLVCLGVAALSFALMGLYVAVRTGLATFGVTTACTPSRAPLVAAVGGVVLLGLAAGMSAVQRAAGAPWSASETWLDATIDEHAMLHFEGGAPRRATGAPPGYVGPMVVIPFGQADRGAFRGDGAPDDGWVVPGTRASLREAASRVERASLSLVFAVALSSVCAAVVALLGA